MAFNRPNRNWVFTLNNYTLMECEMICNQAVACIASGSLKYLVYGKEVGQSGTLHLQGLVLFKDAKTRSAVKTWFGTQRIHLEPMKDTSFQNASNYCKKGKQSHAEWELDHEAGAHFGEDAEVMEFGILPSDKSIGQKAKDDYAGAVQAAKEGRFDDIDPKMYLRFYGTLKAIHRDHMQSPPDLNDTCGEWIVGAPGLGKSRYVRYHYPGFYHKLPNKWWDGYQGQEVVLVEDMDPSHAWMAYSLKIWMDRYAFPIETKGGAGLIRPKKIVVTSNFTIEEILASAEGSAVQIEAIKRRMKVIRMAFPFVPPAEEITPPLVTITIDE